MAYLYHDSCKWQQDDFESKEYNPIKLLQESLLTSKNLDDMFITDNTAPCPIDWIGKTCRNIIIEQIENNIKIIENMEYRTMSEYRNLNPNEICPKCGKKSLHLD